MDRYDVYLYDYGQTRMITGQNKYASVSLLGPRQDATVSSQVDSVLLPLNVCP